MSTKQCTVCKQEKELTEYYKRKGKPISECKKCNVARTVRTRCKIRHNRNAVLYRDKAAHNAREAERRARKRQQTTQWADKQYIKDLYSGAQEASKVFGIQFDVDHIVPLKGKTVRGFHCEDNLQVLPSSLNYSKKNSEEHLEKFYSVCYRLGAGSRYDIRAGLSR